MDRSLNGPPRSLILEPHIDIEMKFLSARREALANLTDGGGGILSDKILAFIPPFFNSDLYYPTSIHEALFTAAGYCDYVQGNVISLGEWKTADSRSRSIIGIRQCIYSIIPKSFLVKKWKSTLLDSSRGTAEQWIADDPRDRFIQIKEMLQTASVNCRIEVDEALIHAAEDYILHLTGKNISSEFGTSTDNVSWKAKYLQEVCGLIDRMSASPRALAASLSYRPDETKRNGNHFHPLYNNVPKIEGLKREQDSQSPRFCLRKAPEFSDSVSESSAAPDDGIHDPEDPVEIEVEGGAIATNDELCEVLKQYSNASERVTRLLRRKKRQVDTLKLMLKNFKGNHRKSKANYQAWGKELKAKNRGLKAALEHQKLQTEAAEKALESCRAHNEGLQKEVDDLKKAAETRKSEIAREAEKTRRDLNELGEFKRALGLLGFVQTGQSKS